VGDVEFYAVYKEIPRFDIIFLAGYDINGQAEIDFLAEYVPQLIMRGERVVSVTPPARAGFTFNGWFIKDGTTVTNVMWNFGMNAVSGDLVLVAVWTPDAFWAQINDGTPRGRLTVVGESTFYLVMFHPGDGWVIRDITFEGIEIGEFAEGGIVQSFDAQGRIRFDWIMPAANVTINVEFERLPQYEVVFNSNGGSAVPKQTGIYEGGHIMDVAPPQRVGFAFMGWFLADSDDPWVFGDNEIESGMGEWVGTVLTLTLIAKWEQDAFTVYVRDGDWRTNVSPIGFEVTIWLQQMGPGYSYKGFKVTATDDIDAPDIRLDLETNKNLRIEMPNGNIKFLFDMPGHDIYIWAIFEPLTPHTINF